MLLSLSISDFVLVEQLSLDFAPGFSVLTGETGAGKSILLDAISLVLGERADAGVVREGAARAEISAEFAVPADSGLSAWLDENDLRASPDPAGEDDALLMRRVVETSGRSRAFINGRPATAQQLKEAGEFLVDIHGQHAHYSLLKTVEQRRLLDAFGASTDLAADTARVFRNWRDLAARREAAQKNAGEQDAERERLAWVEQELAGLDFSSQGWRDLQEEHRRLAHAAELATGAQTASETLDAEESGLLNRLRALRGNLADLAAIDPSLNEPLGLLESATETLHEAARELSRYADKVDLDPEALNLAEARLTAVQAVARKFRLRPEEIPDHLATIRAQLAELGAAADLAGLAQAEAEAEATYRKLAQSLSKQRGAAAGKLGKAVSAAMQQLSMQGGSFEAGLIAGGAAAHGLEEVEFRVSPHAGQGVKPLAKTASGGELSRIGLALQTVLSGTSGAPTLLFDEVDSGIGGGIAEIVGRMLAELGGVYANPHPNPHVNPRQVLCVTHLPQVAARAARHYRVSKETRAGKAVSSVMVLSHAERVEEIARMLGGVKLTDATRAHAEEMLAA
ncbi:MAG: DNA repair protein RecN [Hydrogenophilales bacterium 28-61-23]|nr:MAG: DNA repair protein RecN [Hydrogenophilales bacterium 28-61-23]